jgi:large subunit ribosomal protein L29
MNFAEVQGLTIDELKRKLRDTREELFQLRMKNKLGQVGNMMSIRSSRRGVAQILTALSQKLSK